METVSLEVSKKLKLPEGFEHDFVWHNMPSIISLAKPSWQVRMKTPMDKMTKITLDGYEEIPALTLCEILELLPEWIETKNMYFHRILLGGCIRYCCLKHHYILEHSSFYFKSEANLTPDNPATAAARLRMWLVENGHIKGER